jgi:hypothetical protein
VYGCALGPVAAQISHEDSDTSDSDVETMYPPDDIPDCLANPKSDAFGLGYSGLDRRPVLSGSGHINLFEPSITNMPRAGVSGFRGQAFGVGAFEVEDTDIYQADDMSNYDFALESATERKRKQRWDRENQKVFLLLPLYETNNFYLNITISVLPRQYLVPEFSHMGFNIASELRYEVLPWKYRYVIL